MPQDMLNQRTFREVMYGYQTERFGRESLDAFVARVNRSGGYIPDRENFLSLVQGADLPKDVSLITEANRGSNPDDVRAITIQRENRALTIDDYGRQAITTGPDEGNIYIVTVPYWQNGIQLQGSNFKPTTEEDGHTPNERFRILVLNPDEVVGYVYSPEQDDFIVIQTNEDPNSLQQFIRDQDAVPGLDADTVQLLREVTAINGLPEDKRSGAFDAIMQRYDLNAMLQTVLEGGLEQV